MNTETPNNYIITYSNHFEFNGRLLAFRKKHLFDITDLPILINYNNIGNYWLINRLQLTILKAKNLIINKPINVDVSSIQWHLQIQLDEVFNL